MSGAAVFSEAAGEGDDQSLVHRVQAGDRGAFDQLVRKYQRRVLRLALRLTHDLCDAEDAAQEAFMMAYRGLPHFRRECSFYTWLYRISINSAKNVLAARMRGAALFVNDSGSPYGDDHAAEESAELKDADTPENLVLTDEICQLVNAAVASLPEEQRVAVLLRELEGYSYESIARVMASPVGTVRSRIYRARELIDARLRQVFDEGLGREHPLGSRAVAHRRVPHRPACAAAVPAARLA